MQAVIDSNAARACAAVHGRQQHPLIKRRLLGCPTRCMPPSTRRGQAAMRGVLRWLSPMMLIALRRPPCPRVMCDEAAIACMRGQAARQLQSGGAREAAGSAAQCSCSRTGARACEARVGLRAPTCATKTLCTTPRTCAPLPLRSNPGPWCHPAACARPLAAGRRGSGGVPAAAHRWRVRAEPRGACHQAVHLRGAGAQVPSASGWKH